MKRLFGSALKTLGFLTIVLAFPLVITLFGAWGILLGIYIIGVGILLYIIDAIVNYLIKNQKIFNGLQITLAIVYLLFCSWTYMKWQEHNTIIFPSNFKGEAAIIFGIKGYPELSKTKFWKKEIHIPENRVIITSTKEEEIPSQVRFSFKDNSKVDYSKIDWKPGFEIDCIISDSRIKSWLFRIDGDENSMVQSVMTDLCTKIIEGKETSFYTSRNNPIVPDNRGKYLSLTSRELSLLPNGLKSTGVYKAILTDNDFTEIPKQILEIESLQHLIMAANPISDFPCNLQELKRLKSVSFAATKIKEINCDLSTLDSLEHFDISRNGLIKFPEQIKSVPNLIQLSLNGNSFTDISFLDKKLNKLETLYLYSNEIERIPEEIKYLSNLKELLIFDNKIDSIPEYISELKSLEKLEIWDNPIKYISPEIKNLKRLKQMRIDDDHLTSEDKEILKELLPNCQINFQTRADKHK
ncbi:MAG: leucine-rich repeat domain-containing protein [Cyclobacteriaceae bacterium]|nr:leucine-rich repeat domain-containing protein [Cyclobacteriaceae bacterium]